MNRLLFIVLSLIVLVLCESANAAGARDRKGRTFSHIVNQGEDFYQIVSRYGVDIKTVLEDNPYLKPEELLPGQKIVMRRRQRGKTPQAEIDIQWKQILQTKQTTEVEQESVHSHIVLVGETVYGISRRYSVAVDSLVAYNEEQLVDGLKMGDTLQIPLPKGVSVEELLSKEVVKDNSLVEQYVAQSACRRVDKRRPLELSMLLPLNTMRGIQGQFVDFYRGALIALEELKGEGISVNLSLRNTANSPSVVDSIVSSGVLDNANLIIGPVYAESFGVVANYATLRGVPVVSPLAVVDGVDNPCVFQAPVSGGDKYERIRDLFNPSNRVVVVSMAAGADDKALYEEVKDMLPLNAVNIQYDKELPVTVLEEILTDTAENVFLVLPTAEMAVDEILARISSVQNNLSARSIKNASITVVGSSRWLRFQNIDRMIYFKLNLHTVTTYHADRGNQAVREFDNSYLKAYAALPTLYSYRGYDVTKLFVYGMARYGESFREHINDLDVELLQTPYHFEQTNGGGMANRAWVVVNYGRNFEINVQ